MDIAYVTHTLTDLVQLDITNGPDHPVRYTQMTIRVNTVLIKYRKFIFTGEWEAIRVTVSGPRLRKNGELGVSYAKDEWVSISSIPDWLGTLVTEHTPTY